MVSSTSGMLGLVGGGSIGGSIGDSGWSISSKNRAVEHLWPGVNFSSQL